MSQVKSVLFDSGNTLIDFRPSERRAIEILERHTGRRVSEEQALPFFEAAFRHAFGEGLLWVTTWEAELRYWGNYYHGWLEAVGIEPSERLVDELVAETLKPEIYAAFSDARPVLEELKRRGIKLALVSNAFPSMRLLVEGAGLAGYLDLAIYSCEVGCEKPNAQIFDIALKGIGADPSECLFVDDLPPNIEAGMSLGIRGLLLDRWGRHAHSPLPRITDLSAILDELG